jgi:hypothetical protein
MTAVNRSVSTRHSNKPLFIQPKLRAFCQTLIKRFSRDFKIFHSAHYLRHRTRSFFACHFSIKLSH